MRNIKKMFVKNVKAKLNCLFIIIIVTMMTTTLQISSHCAGAVT